MPDTSMVYKDNNGFLFLGRFDIYDITGYQSESLRLNETLVSAFITKLMSNKFIKNGP